MIKKIITIKNIGKFVNCNYSGDVAFRDLTLVYAENGRGKTTLCDIIRSLKTNDGGRIAGRATLGNSDSPFAEILLDGDKLTFKDGSWSQPHPTISVFDSAFVHENVYAGDVVDHEHKKNLYRVIVGEQGVALAHAVDALDSDIRDVNKELKTAKKAVQDAVPDGVTLKKFLTLEDDPDIEKKIAQAETNVAALTDASNLKSRRGVAPLQLPVPHAELKEVLAKTIDDVSPDAEKIVKDHISDHMAESGESWLLKGLSQLRGTQCPFCGQSLDGVSLIESYRTHFSDSYEQLKRDVKNIQSSLLKSFSDAVLPSIQKTLAENQSSIDYWNRFVDLPDAPNVDVEQCIHPSLVKLRDITNQLLSEKLSAPLEPINIGEEFSESLAKYEDAQAVVEEYSSFVTAANAIIEDKKKQVDAGDLANAKSGLSVLRAKQLRNEAPTDAACKRYEELLKKKAQLEADKEKAKEQLDTYSQNVFGQYETRINRLLMMFNAGFRITGTKRRYVGGTPSSSYELLINDVQVDVGDEGTPHDSASFKNTLSSGDRSTLALAFFLVQVERDPNLSDMVVVFDDPFTSQDRSRRACTQQQITKLVGTAKQVIVLSHEPTFLRSVWDAAPSVNTKTLQLARLGQQTTITEWDIQEATKANYVQMHGVLAAYRDEGTGDRRHVAQTIRPLLENYLRMKLPREFGDNEWLGNFISKIRDSDDSSPLNAAKSILEEVEDINDYSKKYHHNTNSAADTEPIDDGELESYAKRTLEVVGGF